MTVRMYRVEGGQAGSGFHVEIDSTRDAIEFRGGSLIFSRNGDPWIAISAPWECWAVDDEQAEYVRQKGPDPEASWIRLVRPPASFDGGPA